jgi:CheY-like chemotaxis protein
MTACARDIDVTTPNLLNLFPAITEQSQQPSSESQQPTTRMRGILVVDDDEGARNVLGAWMRRQGYTVWLAEGGEEAIGLCSRHGAAIDIVLMDVQMSNMDGPQTLAELRKLYPHVRCCFMSGDTGAYTEEELRAMSKVALLRKPFRLAEIPLILWQLETSV